MKEDSKNLSVRSFYFVIFKQSSIDNSVLALGKACNLLWASQVPMKINVFDWRTLLDKLATKDQLKRRGILSSIHDLPCIFCFLFEENLQNLFLECGVAASLVCIDMWVRR